MSSKQQVREARSAVPELVGDVFSEAADDEPWTDVPTWPGSAGKRMFDVVLATLALPVVVPVVAIAGAISMARFGAWPLFFQERRGLHGRPFRALKIRSLPRSFPEQQGKHGLDVSGLGRWSSMLRHSHVDELPQIFNVLTGSMSVVGPRPMIDAVLASLEPRDREVRALVRPGLTGAWQVSTAGARPLHECTDLDELYVRSSSARVDLMILRWTILLLTRRRSFTPDQVRSNIAR